jgi:CRP-like cAMP-binding protein
MITLKLLNEKSSLNVQNHQQFQPGFFSQKNIDDLEITSLSQRLRSKKLFSYNSHNRCDFRKALGRILKESERYIMTDRLIDEIQLDDEKWVKLKNSFIEREIASKTVLLQEGEVSNYIHYIKKGCLRQWFNKDGKDITFQFFFENQPVASIESFVNNQPSLFSIESLEPSIIFSISKENFQKLMGDNVKAQNYYQTLIFQRLNNYAHLFLSRIKDTPQERYEDLIKNYPEILKRIPQHYIASFLGITPISLSRIRNRK